MKKMITEFKEFIMRGNVLDMAVGVIIATAFGAITTSLVNDVFMPLISWIFGARDMSALNVVIPEVTNEYGTVIKEGATIGFGTFLATVIDFILVALVVFAVVKSFNKAREITEKNKKAEEEIAPAGPTTEELLSQILEELKKKGRYKFVPPPEGRGNFGFIRLRCHPPAHRHNAFVNNPPKAGTHPP